MNSPFAISDVRSTNLPSQSSSMMSYLNQILEQREKLEADDDQSEQGAIKRAFVDLVKAMHESSEDKDTRHMSYSRDYGSVEVLYRDRDRMMDARPQSHGVTMWKNGNPRDVKSEDMFSGRHMAITDQLPMSMLELGNIRDVDDEGNKINEILVFPTNIFSSTEPGVAVAAMKLADLCEVLFDERKDDTHITVLTDDATLAHYMGMTSNNIHGTSLFAGPVVSDRVADNAIIRYASIWFRNLFENSFLKFTGNANIMSRQFVEDIINFFLDGNDTIELPDVDEGAPPRTAPTLYTTRVTTDRYLIARKSLPERHQATFDTLVKALDILRMWFVCSYDVNRALLFDGRILEEQDTEVFLDLLRDFREEIGVGMYEEAYWEKKIPADDLLISKTKMTVTKRH